MGDSEKIEIKFSDSYPNLAMTFGKKDEARYHVLIFNQNIDDIVYKKLSNSCGLFTMESLRLAFGRIAEDNILCVLTIV